MASSKAACRKRRREARARKERFRRKIQREEAARLLREQWQKEAAA